MQWNDNYVPELERTIGQRVQASGYYLLGEIRKVVSVAGRTITYVPGRSGKLKKVIGPMHSAPSAPGDAPHRQTGRYRASLAQSFDASLLTSRVGSPMKLSYWLELGTKRMAARPHLRPTLTAFRDVIMRIITTGSSK